MKFTLGILSVFLLIQLVTAPPPRRGEPEEKKHENSQEKDELEDFGLEYNRYLKEVIDLLESDPEFKRKLEDAQEADIRSGQIAKELEYVDHKVRTKLDEVKRQEIERLRHLAQKQYELNNGIETEHVKVSSEHLDHENPHTFEMEDLKKLIAKVSADLNEADEKRRQEFKEYEMQKEFEKQQKLKHLEGSEKEAFEKQLKENETKHKQHEPLHHPGSKQQLEEVWEKQDHMENQEFDPKVFFQLHDLDGNGFWDHNEVKTLFLKELDKMYEAGAPEDDMKERVEEMERMREHVFGEADKNKDGLISYEEFIDKTKQPDFNKDPGWESLDQKPVFTEEEYREFERRRQQEVQRMIDQGLIPQQPVFHPGQGYHPQPQYVPYHPPQYQNYPAAHGYPSHGQPPYRYAQDFPNQPPQHGYPHQQGHPNQPQGYPNPPLGNQQHPSQGYQQGQQQHYQQQGQAHQQPQQHYQQQGQAHQQPQQHYQQQQGQAHQQPQQQYQQQQGQAQQQPQQHYQQQGQAHQQSQEQHYQQPNQPQQQNQQYQQPQGSHGYQQQQGSQNIPQQGYQQPNQPPAQNNQAPLTNSNPPSQGQVNQPVQNHPNQGYQQNQQPPHDPNEIYVQHQQQPDPKYSKDAGNAHPNVIDSQQKKAENTNDHPSKLSNH